MGSVPETLKGTMTELFDTFEKCGHHTTCKDKNNCTCGYDKHQALLMQLTAMLAAINTATPPKKTEFTVAQEKESGPVKKKASRYFSSVIDKDELAARILEAVKKNDEAKEALDDLPSKTSIEKKIEQIAPYLREINSKVEDDLSKVEFDLENISTEGYGDKAKDIIGFQMLDNGLTYLGVMAGGDWELPVFFIIYWDGKSLRGYIPTEGNMFNTSTMSAYGNKWEPDGLNPGEETDQDNAKKRFGIEIDPGSNGLEVEPDKVIEDIQNRIAKK